MATLSTIKTGNSREKGQDGRRGKIQGNVQTFICVFDYCGHYDIVNHRDHCDYCKSIELSNVQLFTLLYYSTLEPNVPFATVIVA